jgi:hypothetical protein
LRAGSATITNLIATSASITTLTNNPTFSGGTANGVLYLNGSKVATSAADLTFTSTGLGIGTASPGQKLDIITDSNAFVGQRIRNNDTGSSAYAGLILNPNGNSWGIRSGSSAANSNSLNFTIDILGTPINLLTLTSSGNLGLGVTPSAYDSGIKAFDIGSGSAILNPNSAGQTWFLTNAYYGSSAFRYKNSGVEATRYDQAVGTHKWFTAPSGTAGAAISFTQAMTLNASGDLGVGTTSPSYKLDVNGNGGFSGTLTLTLPSVVGAIVSRNSSTTAAELHIRPNSGKSGWLSFTEDSVADRWVLGTAAGNGSLIFGTGNPSGYTERARITSGGVVAVNTTGAVYSSEKLAVLAANNSVAAAFKTDAGATEYTIAVSNTATSGDNKFVVFATESTDTIRGSITYNRGAGQVAYNVTSDVRLKDNITNAADAGNKVDALQVRQFDWKETGNHVDYGFVAQELHEVVPHSVSKPEDDGQMWSVDYSKLVPMLVKEIQSLRARVAQLESK